MDKFTAEKVLELTKPYDYPTLRRRWRELCSEYHPDKAASTNMDAAIGDEVLKDINEAFATLKPYVENGRIVTPNPHESSIPFSGAKKPSHETEQSNQADPRESAYLAASLGLMAARTLSDFEVAAELFKSLGAYKDAPLLYEICAQQIWIRSSSTQNASDSRSASEAFARMKHRGKGWEPSDWSGHLDESSSRLSEELLFTAAFMTVLSDGHVIDEGRRQNEFNKEVDRCLQMLDDLLRVKGLLPSDFEESFDEEVLRSSIASNATFDQLCSAPYYHMFRALYSSYLNQNSDIFHSVYAAFDEITDVYAEYVWGDFEEMVAATFDEYEGLADLVAANVDLIEERMRHVDPSYFED